jgi:hypothetical protein
VLKGSNGRRSAIAACAKRRSAARLQRSSSLKISVGRAGEPAYFQSSNLVRRGFCRDCGTPLTYEFEGSHIDITIASLDQPDLVAPEIQLGLENRLSWCEGLADLPTRTEEAEAAAQDVFSNIRNHQHPDRDTDAWPETTR